MLRMLVCEVMRLHSVVTGGAGLPSTTLLSPDQEGGERWVVVWGERGEGERGGGGVTAPWAYTWTAHGTLRDPLSHLLLMLRVHWSSHAMPFSSFIFVVFFVWKALCPQPFLYSSHHKQQSPVDVWILLLTSQMRNLFMFDMCSHLSLTYCFQFFPKTGALSVETSVWKIIENKLYVG